MWLDQVLDDLGLIPENAAPEGGFNLLLCMAEIGGANGVVASTRQSCTMCVVRLCGCVVCAVGYGVQKDWT